MFFILSHLKQSYLKIKQNLFFSFAYNAISIPLASGFFLLFSPMSTNAVFLNSNNSIISSFVHNTFNSVLTPSTAGLMMGMSSVSVVCNSLLLRLRFNNSNKNNNNNYKIHSGNDSWRRRIIGNNVIKKCSTSNNNMTDERDYSKDDIIINNN